MSPRYSFSETMNEISGYGGQYERACRAGTCAGADWFADHPREHPEFFYGTDAESDRVMAGNMAGHALLECIEQTDFIRDDGMHVPLLEEMTEEMRHLILLHTLYIANHGWNQYVAKMTAPVKCVTDEEP